MVSVVTNGRSRFLKRPSLRINDDLDYQDFREKHLTWCRQVGKPPTNVSVIFGLIHHQTNYDEVSWFFWKHNKRWCLHQIDKLLKKFRRLDIELSDACEFVLGYYTTQYKTKNTRSWYVALPKTVTGDTGHRINL